MIRWFGPYQAETPINPLLTPAWPACAVLHDCSSIFNIPSKHFEFVSIASRRLHFAVDKLFSGSRLQPIADLRVDVLVSRPVSLARGRRNDLRLNTLKWIMFGKFHTLVYHAYKTRWISNIESNSILIKEGCYPYIHIFWSWLRWWLNWLFCKRCKKIVDYLLFPFFFSYRLLFNTDDFSNVFLCFCKASLLVSSFLLTATHGCIPALSWPMTGRPKMCSGSGSAAANVGFVRKQANSILGSAILCCSTICNCKKLPNTICHCCIALRPFGICIVVAMCETKKL